MASTIAFLFPGQGSQAVGMGREVALQFDAGRAAFAEADAALGWEVSRLCFEGPKERLDQTEYTQPALLAASIALLRCMGEVGGRCAYVAGHSLGEYTALVAAGAIPFADALRLVQLRGRFMQEAAPPGEGGMAAVIGLDAPTVEAICAEAGDVVAANLNAPDQIVIAGRADGITRALGLVKEKRGRGIRLAVSVPSHSPMMQPASVRLAAELDQIKGCDPSVPLVNNRTAREVTTWAAARRGLVEQVASPLLWEASIRRLRALGVDLFVEIGPGRVLAGLMKKMDPTVAVLNVEDAVGVCALREKWGA